MKQLFAIFLFIVTIACEGVDPPKTDYALGFRRDAWLHHPVLGDPSFDLFKRYSQNPLQRGTSPLEWPVNGFYFEDPKSGNEYVYAGQYRKNYAVNAEDDITKGCIVFCSTDKGKTWQNKGSIFHDRNVLLNNEEKPISFAPDVSVVYFEGKYYLGFDYATSEFSWSGENLKHGGLAVAVSDSPEGPFTIYKKPAVSTQYFYDKPLFGKYNRCYAGTLLKTQESWIMLFMLDSGSHFSWGLAAVSAPSPKGPWSEPVLIRSVEDAGYYPSLMEFFPAFQYKDTIYAPATSVALNRNYQAIFSVPAARVMMPDQWRLGCEGSLWHSENSENEYAGIWGQTFSGFVNQTGQFKVIFPSLDSQRNGTINLASRDWNKPCRDSGFVFTGQNGASFTAIPGSYPYPEIDASFSFYGSVAIAMNILAPLGPNQPRADATLHPLMFTDQTRVQLSENSWFLLQTSTTGKPDTIGRGFLEKKKHTTLKIGYHGSETVLSVDGKIVWQGVLKNQKPGRVGLFAMSHSGMEIKKFAVSGVHHLGFSTWLYTEGLLNAGNNLNNWIVTKDNPLFKYGIGAVSKNDTARVKWSFKGTGFDLYAPGMPELGRAQIILNGKILTEVNLHAESPEKSKIIYSVRNLLQNKNGLVIKGIKGKIAVDCLSVYD